MSEQVSLNADNREIEGKSSSRLLRRSGSVPAIIYGGSKEPIKISILEKDITKASSVPGFTTQILNISIGGVEEKAIIKEIQRHPATQRVLHADLMRVDLDTKISISVPIRFINEESCVGVKMHGGVVSHLINDVDIVCLASDLPEYLEIDVEELDLGDSVFLSAMKLPKGVEIPALALGEDRDQAVVSVAEPKIIDIEPEIIETEGEEGEESEEGEEGEESEGEESSDDPKNSEGDSEK